MYCSHCGTSYSDAARFCPKCGTPRRQVSFTAAQVPPVDQAPQTGRRAAVRAPAVPAATAAAAKRSSSGTRVLYTALLAIALAALAACAVIWVVQAIGAAPQAQAQLGILDVSTALYGSVLFVALPGVVSLLALFGVFPVITALGGRHDGTQLPKRATTIAALLVAVTAIFFIWSLVAGGSQGTGSLSGVLSAAYAGKAAWALVAALVAAAAETGARALRRN